MSNQNCEKSAASSRARSQLKIGDNYKNNKIRGKFRLIKFDNTRTHRKLKPRPIAIDRTIKTRPIILSNFISLEILFALHATD